MAPYLDVRVLGPPCLQPPLEDDRFELLDRVHATPHQIADASRARSVPSSPSCNLASRSEGHAGDTWPPPESHLLIAPLNFSNSSHPLGGRRDSDGTWLMGMRRT